MKKLLVGLLVLGSFSVMASINKDSCSVKAVSVIERLHSYETCSFVIDSIKDIEREYNVICERDDVTTGAIMDNPLINRTIYKASCNSDELALKVKIISSSPVKSLLDDSDSLTFNLKKVNIKTLK